MKKERKRRSSKQDKGITLIALVITIIILLILAGVTLNGVLSENGLFRMAKKSVDKYDVSSEREALEMSVASYQLGEFSGGGVSEKIGEELIPRNMNHGDNWHIVNADGKKYDNDAEKGWNYVEKGANIEGYGDAKHSWLVNYETGEIKELEEGKYTDLSAGDMLYVKDNLIMNFDSSMIDEGWNSESEVEEKLGSNIQLEGFEDGVNVTVDEGGATFSFDGENDYVDIPITDDGVSSKIKENGFTLDLCARFASNGVDNNSFSGIFCFTYEDTSRGQPGRFGVDLGAGQFTWNLRGIERTVVYR